jgi:hypothetical protein
MGDCVMETTLKLWTTPLTLKSTLGVVSGVLGIVVDVLSKTELMTESSVIDGLNLKGAEGSPMTI